MNVTKKWFHWKSWFSWKTKPELKQRIKIKQMQLEMWLFEVIEIIVLSFEKLKTKTEMCAENEKKFCIRMILFD